jgi:hypothetical protein
MTKPLPEIRLGLARIRRRRRLFLFILFSFLPVLVPIMALIGRTGNWLPILVPGFLFLAGLVVQHRLHRSRCPKCHEFFFVQTVTRDNYTPASSISFPPQKTCQHCGLRLYP